MQISNHTFGVFLCATLALLCGCTAISNTDSLPMHDNKLSKIDAAIRRDIAAKKMPGAVFLAHQSASAANPKGQTHRRAYGALHYAVDAQSTAFSTVFDAASLTKAVATTPSVMRLNEMGKLDIEAPVAQYLPNCFAPPYREGAQAITIRHLLTHTSSLPAGLASALDYSGDARAKVFSYAWAAAPTHAPGKFFRYSDINFILLGLLVETVSGMSLDRFADTQIFAPLKMQHTRYTPLLGSSPVAKNSIAPTQIGGSKPLDSPTRLHLDVATGAMLQGVVHDPTARRMGGVAGHAGLFTTVDDLRRYAQMLLNGGSLDGVQVLSAASVTLMSQSQTAANVMGLGEPPMANIKRTLGLDMDSPFSRARGTLAKDGTSTCFSFSSFGHTGFTGCILWIDPTRNGFYIFLSNRVYPDDSANILPLYFELGDLTAALLRENQ